jgi:hypothetical protein
LLPNPNVTELEKVRLILLYIVAKDGITAPNLRKLVGLAKLDQGHEKIIRNLANLGINSVVQVRTRLLRTVKIFKPRYRQAE